MVKNDLQPMVGVAQLVEHWVVAPVVVGSSPITHPINFYNKRGSLAPSFVDLASKEGAKCSLFCCNKPLRREPSAPSFIDLSPSSHLLNS